MRVSLGSLLGLGDCAGGVDTDTGDPCGGSTDPGSISPVTGGSCIYGVDTNGNCLNAPYTLPASSGGTVQPLPTSAAGGVITLPIFSFPSGRRFHFRDPSGNELAVWTALSD